MIKLSKVISIIKSGKTIIIYNKPDCQWLGCHHAIYPLHGLPLMDKSNIFTMMDIPADDQSKYHINEDGELGSISLADAVLDEEPLGRNMFWITLGGEIFEPICTSVGIKFISVKYLLPFDNLKAGYELYRRETFSGESYIAVKSGLLLVGIIYPSGIVSETFVEQCERLYKLSESELYKLE